MLNQLAHPYVPFMYNGLIKHGSVGGGLYLSSNDKLKSMVCMFLCFRKCTLKTGNTKVKRSLPI